MKPRVNYSMLYFPVAHFDAPTGRMAIYYGGTDTYTCIAYVQFDELIDFIKANSEGF